MRAQPTLPRFASRSYGKFLQLSPESLLISTTQRHFPTTWGREIFLKDGTRLSCSPAGLELHLAEAGNPIYFNAKIFREGRKPARGRHLLFRFQIPCVNLMFLGNPGFFSRNLFSRNWWARRDKGKAEGAAARGSVLLPGADLPAAAVEVIAPFRKRVCLCAHRKGWWEAIHMPSPHQNQGNSTLLRKQNPAHPKPEWNVSLGNTALGIPGNRSFFEQPLQGSLSQQSQVAGSLLSGLSFFLFPSLQSGVPTSVCWALSAWPTAALASPGPQTRNFTPNFTSAKESGRQKLALKIESHFRILYVTPV